ncbi:hypothetical protein BWGOE2_55200 [Bacillus mycoides]|nr:hypothetical protein BWGOE2_55200 [Bacillus mycoides]
MWDADEIKKGWDMNLIKKYKLGGMIALVYHFSQEDSFLKEREGSQSSE